MYKYISILYKYIEYAIIPDVSAVSNLGIGLDMFLKKWDK